MLCSLASPCFLMWVCKGGQYKTCGNVITFSQDISNLCATLPRLPKDLDVLLIRKPNARDPSTYRDFRVRKAKVLRFLRFLKANNSFYAHIEIRQPDDVESSIFRLMGTFWTSYPSLNLNNVVPLPTHTTVLMKRSRISVNEGKEEWK
jgi:hypothetical protein